MQKGPHRPAEEPRLRRRPGPVRRHGLPAPGKINFADPSFSQDTGSFLVRAVLPNPKRELQPGMFVTANVKGARARTRWSCRSSPCSRVPTATWSMS